MPGSGDRDEDANGGAGGGHGGRAEGSELLIGFDTLGLGIPDGEAGKVGSAARGWDQRPGSCLGSKERQHLPALKKKQDFQVVTSTHWSQSSFDEQRTALQRFYPTKDTYDGAMNN